jgi:D-alanyl-lipoteichoic acid acyltransferase DltB (MBOAT superfamily)
MLAICHLWTSVSQKMQIPRMPAAIAWAITFVCVSFAWVPFRAPDLHVTASMWRGMVGLKEVFVPQIGFLGTLAERLGIPSAKVGIDALTRSLPQEGCI